MNPIQPKTYPLQDIEKFLDDEYLLYWLPHVENGFFHQYLTYVDYIGERLRERLYDHIEEAFKGFWFEVMACYWEKEANQHRAEFLGHRMLVILERVNLSYYLYPYFGIVEAMLLDFERRAKHHLDLDLKLSERLKSTDRFRLNPSQRSHKDDVPAIATLEPDPVITSFLSENKPKPTVKPLYHKPYKTNPELIIDGHMRFLNPATKNTKSPLSSNEYQELRLIILTTVQNRVEVSKERVFHNITRGTGITKDKIKKHFAQFMRELAPDDRPRWFTNSIATLFGIKNQDSVYKNWPTENSEM